MKYEQAKALQRLASCNIKINERCLKSKNLDRIFKGEDDLIPRIPMIPTDMTFQFKRLQLPTQLSFVITTNNL